MSKGHSVPAYHKKSPMRQTVQKCKSRLHSVVTIDLKSETWSSVLCKWSQRFL